MNNTTMTPKRKGGTKDARMNQRQPGPRFLMWVDGVGGYLVCLADEILLGQAIANSGADVPIVGDLSRHHASIARQGENYVIRPDAMTRVEGRELTSPRTLRDGDEIELGPSFRLRFRQPHPLSTTCRLDFLSHHRTQPATDGVILMANSCILGPNTKNHVVCRGWNQDVVLVRNGQRLRCHAKETLEIDGQEVDRRAEITLQSRIVGSDFCLSLERFD